MAMISSSRAGILVLSMLVAGCSRETPVATRKERIDRTQEALSVVLTADAALSEAERLVDLCDESPAEFGEASPVINPDGLELFESIRETQRTLEGGTVVLVDEQACTASSYAELQVLRDI